ncbi:MAG: type II toxin-antitoxin system RelE/ParE family toxin [Candidatus Margulisbacteria bacterium]|jgi:plasmid stabilization system protein ParE|nr:type II toxin-antitoxin system RelE/ParE family toxin [Candidatus Margulisiibacteriota bacterium]
MFKIRYLPLAHQDLEDTLDYFARILQSAQAAESFLNTVEKTIQLLKNFPFCHKYFQHFTLQ